MELTPEIITLGTELATIAGRKSVQAIIDKIKTVKQKGDKDEIINNLEEIINELISDKNKLIQISQAYEEVLITQKISQDEIDYITNSIIPLLEEFLKQSTQEDAEKIQSGIDMFKPILSKEFFNMMQILGFNFKQAIGEPLIEYFKICQDEESYKRLMNTIQNNN